jgi:hypothetical protein
MEESQGPSVPIFNFPVLSDDRESAGGSLAEIQPGERLLSDEKVYTTDDDWSKLEYIGDVTIQETRSTRPGKILFTALFDFREMGTVEVSGLVPGNGNWNDKGQAGSGRGTGDFTGKRGPVPIEGRNPKRWG